MSDIGKMAENLLSMWCAEEALTVNTSNSDDNMGWDHFIEFPLKNTIENSLVHHSAPKCKIQVKATNKRDRKLQVTLSNLRKMAVDPLPNFFLFVEYDNTTNAQKVFLRYVDNVLIHQILKKVHKINASSKENKFNKKSMQVKYDEQHQLIELTGNCFTDTLLKYLGDDFNQLIENKKKFLDNVGYDDENLNIKFNVVGEQDLEKMIDLCLGLQDEVEIQDVKAFEKRFGLSTPKSSMTSASAKLSMPDIKPSSKANLIFTQGGLNQRYRFAVDVFIPAFITDFNNPYFKTRFVGEFFEIQLKNNSSEMNFSINFGDKAFELNTFLHHTKFLSELMNGEKLNILVEKDGQNFPFGSIGLENQLVDYFPDVETLAKIKRVVNFFEISEPVKINADELNFHVNGIDPYLNLLKGDTSTFKIAFTAIDCSPTTSDEHALLGGISFTIGKHNFYILYSAIGTLSLIGDNRYECINNEFNIEKLFSVEKQVAVKTEDIVEQLKTLEQKFSDYPVITLSE